jgi:hypothetical protein
MQPRAAHESEIGGGGPPPSNCPVGFTETNGSLSGTGVSFYVPNTSGYSAINGSSGTYRWRVYSFSGSGSFRLCTRSP